MRALLHEMIARGVSLERDSFGQGGPSFKGVLAGHRKNPAGSLEVLECDSAGSIEIGFCDIEEPLDRGGLGPNYYSWKLAEELRSGPARPECEGRCEGESAFDQSAVLLVSMGSDLRDYLRCGKEEIIAVFYGMPSELEADRKNLGDILVVADCVDYVGGGLKAFE